MRLKSDEKVRKWQWRGDKGGGGGEKKEREEGREE